MKDLQPCILQAVAYSVENIDYNPENYLWCFFFFLVQDVVRRQFLFFCSKHDPNTQPGGWGKEHLQTAFTTNQ